MGESFRSEVQIAGSVAEFPAALAAPIENSPAFLERFTDEWRNRSLFSMP
jgi:hypothetical protein